MFQVVEKCANTKTFEPVSAKTPECSDGVGDAINAFS